MTFDPLAATHKAIYAAMREALVSLDVTVYDFVPQNASFPYVEIDRMDADERNMLNDLKDSVFTYISVWSKYEGQKEVLEIMEIIYSALNNKQLPMDQGRMVNCNIERRSTTRDTDRLTFTGSITAFSIVEHT